MFLNHSRSSKHKWRTKVATPSKSYDRIMKENSHQIERV